MKIPRQTRVLVVGSDDLTRTGIVFHLDRRKGRYRTLAVADAVKARAACGREKPAVILLVLPLRGADGLGLLKELGRLAPEAVRVVVGVAGDGETVERVLAAGASGFIDRDEAVAVFDEALEALQRGERFVSPRASQVVLSRVARRASARRPAGGQVTRDGAQLSDRELAIYRAMGEGRGPTLIAGELGISVKTVETHQRRMREKLGLRSAADLRQRARRWAEGE